MRSGLYVREDDVLEVAAARSLDIEECIVSVADEILMDPCCPAGPSRTAIANEDGPVYVSHVLPIQACAVIVLRRCGALTDTTGLRTTARPGGPTSSGQPGRSAEGGRSRVRPSLAKTKVPISQTLKCNSIDSDHVRIDRFSGGNEPRVVLA